MKRPLVSIAFLALVGAGCGSLSPAIKDEFLIESGLDAADDTDLDGADDPVDGNPDNSANVPPRADAGDDIEGFPGETLTLDGRGSSDVDGDTLAFHWQFTALPPGSQATLLNADFDTASFYADVDGIYEAELTVTDGLDSDTDTVLIFIEDDNLPPIANAGSGQSVSLGDTVQLNGNGSSDPDGDPLSYHWTFVSRPPGSNAQLSGTTLQPAVSPRFSADQAGTFVVQLIVEDDSSLRSAPDIVSITAQDQSSSDDCLSCADADQQLRAAASAGHTAGGAGLAFLPLLVLFWQRRREDPFAEPSDDQAADQGSTGRI